MFKSLLFKKPAIALIKTVKSISTLNTKQLRKIGCWSPKIQAEALNNEDEDNVITNEKIKLIKQMNFKTANDAKPFLQLSKSTLIKILRSIKSDEKNGFCKNRVYYIAMKIKYPAPTLSSLISRRTFVLTMPADWLKQSLDVLVEMGVPGERIARDLWVLKYHHETIRHRLQLVQKIGADSLFPWMVRCSEDILKRSIEIKQETKNILGHEQSTQNYLATRLNVSLDYIEEECRKYPTLKTIRVIKVKKFLDFLISEGFEVEDIARKLRVISSSQATVKERLTLLRNMGVQNINLNVLCKCNSDFDKYCNLLNSNTNKNR